MYIPILQQKIIHYIIIIQQQLRHIRIYKVLSAVIGIAVLLYIGIGCHAAEFGTIKYDDAVIDYSAIDKQAVLRRADYYFDKALKTDNKEKKQDLLRQASGEYFILTRIEPHNIHHIVQLARIYDIENKNSYAKGYFFNALKIDKNNAKTNYYIGEYYYKRREYAKALHFYNTAFENGYSENYEILIKTAVIYEKLGDLLRANQYYKKAYTLNPGNSKIAAKIKEIERIKYKNTGYYKKIKEK